MKKPKVLFGKIFVLVLLFVLSGCGETNVINVGCSAPELIDAINQANNDGVHSTLNLTSNCDYVLARPDNQSGEFGSTGLPVITTDINILGNDSRIRRKSLAFIVPDFRIFKIGITGTLKLYNLTLENGAVMSASRENNGGAISNSGQLSLFDSSVLNNRVAGYGGGIANTTGAELEISNTTFINNTAQDGGGAIFNGGTLDIWQDSLFQDNSSEMGGGAIQSWDSNYSVSGSRFEDNHSDSNGGAIECRISPGGASIATFNIVTFENNTATGAGGAISNERCDLRIYESNFTTNRANGDGGAIDNKGNFTVSQESWFIGNVAQGFGGAIMNQEGSVFVSQGNTSYRDNSAGRDGGAITVSGYSQTISTGTFEGNQAGQSGGAIYCSPVTPQTFLIENVTFTGNSAPYGGAFNNFNCDFHITGGTFQENTATNEGGAIYNSTWGIGRMINYTELSLNEAEYGGAIANYGTLNMETMQILTNDASESGGGIYNADSMVVWKSLIRANTARIGGGVSNRGILTIDQSTLHHNIASNSVGALYSTNVLRLANSTVAFNSAEFTGGVSISSGTAVIEFSTLVENRNTNTLMGSNRFLGGTVEIRNSILAENDGDCSVSSGASVTASGVNLHLDGTCPGFTLMALPELGPLGNHGGATVTLPPMTGSPVIDAVPLEDCTWVDGRQASNDQRNFTRPHGTACDIGAVESEFSSAPIPPPPSPPDTPPPTQPPFACVELLGVTVRGDGTIRIQLETQDLPEGEYEAEVGKYDFTCKTYRDYPDRLFCDGPKGKGGTLVTLAIFDADGNIICQEDFTIPAPEQPATKEPSEGVDCTEKYGDNYSSCVLDPACKWSDPDYMCYNK